MMNEVDWWGLETQHSDTVTRDELKTSLAAAIARAEAAEKRVAELEKEATRHHEDYDGLYQDYEEVKAKWEGTADIGAELYTLRQRVKELEAKLAAVGDSGE